MSDIKENYYALIMAGGGGTRLWPLSRKDRPKQALSLIGESSMFRVSVQRLFGLFDPSHIFVVTGANMVEGLRTDAPELPAENFIIEPFGQESGPAAGLGTTHILAQNPNATIAVLTSDHHIADVEGFLNVLKSAYEVAQRGMIVTLGISPSFPSTGFGYIERGEQFDTVSNYKVYYSNGFKEKPDQQTAIEFLASGRYSWNAGMFIWQGQQVMGEFEKQHPTMYKHFEDIRQAFNTSRYTELINAYWPSMTKLSIDYTIMEHASKVAVIPVDIGWSDIGSWSALYDVLVENNGANNGKNIVHSTQGQSLRLDTTGSLIVSDRTVVTIGVDDLVIVDTDDVLMICHRDRSQDVRQIVNRLREMGRDDLL